MWGGKALPENTVLFASKGKKNPGKHESIENVTPWFSSIIKLPGNKTVQSSVVLSLVLSGIKR